MRLASLALYVRRRRFWDGCRFIGLRGGGFRCLVWYRRDARVFPSKVAAVAKEVHKLAKSSKVSVLAILEDQIVTN